MHMVIRTIVFAKDKEGAIEKAKQNFENLCGGGKTFDYYQMFGTEDDKSECSGSGRWGSLPTAVLADSKEGKKLIKEGWESTYDEYKGHMKKIRAALKKFSDDEIMEEMEKGTLFVRYNMHEAGSYRGGSIWLYDNEGEGIRDKRHLNLVLKKWVEKEGEDLTGEYKDMKIWVVPADVHL